MVLRCTVKALKLLGLRPAALAEVEAGDDDWYLNLLCFDRRKCLLVTHAATAFAVFVPDVRKHDLDPIGPLVADAIAAALDDEALPANVLGVLDPADVRIAKTASRRVLGVMNDVAYHLAYMLDRFGSVLDVDVVYGQSTAPTDASQPRPRRRPIDLAWERLTKPAS